MSSFEIHDFSTASADSADIMKEARRDFGMVPNLYGVMAESPQLLAAYHELSKLFQKTSLSNAERHVVWLSINVEHRCHYCVPGHSAVAKMQGVDDETISALRSEREIPNIRLEKLRQFTLSMVRNRGFVSDQEIEDFIESGFTKRNILDIVLGLSQKIISNYVNKFAKTPVDEAFLDFVWTEDEIQK